MMTPTVTETGPQLRLRIARTAEAATGIPIDTWHFVLGPVIPTPISWTIASYRGDPTSNMIARRIALEVAEHFGYAPTLAQAEYEIGMFGWSSDIVSGVAG